MFKENLKLLRKMRNVSQTDLANSLGVSLKTVSHWETGYSEPSIEQILLIAEYFSVTTDELLK